MKIYGAKLLDVAVNGQLRTVSVSELYQLIVDRETPALAKQGHDDLKKLIWPIAQIQIHGDWDEVDPWFFVCKCIGIYEGIWLRHRPGVRRAVVNIRLLRGGDYDV